ncbi:MAG: hypothetical protein U0Y10_15590 [Spirosomataceae bacterium]
MADDLPKLLPQKNGTILKKKQKIRRQMPNEFSELVLDDTELEIQQTESHLKALLDEEPNIRRLSGRFERYYYDEFRKTIVKEIVIIHNDGRVTIRAVSGIYRGISAYFMNALLTINLFSMNDDHVLCSQILAYVGRHAFDDIEVLYAITNTINDDNVPIARQEMLVPCQENAALPEVIRPDTLAFFKLEKRYPLLMRFIQNRVIKSPAKVTWE